MPATRQVCIGDRESDLLALLVKARDMDYAADYLVRCQHNRALPEGVRLWDEVMASEPLGRIRFDLPAGRGCQARPVEQELRTQRVTLPDRQGGHLDVTCLIACEINAPADAKPVVWRLLTNRTAATLDAAANQRHPQRLQTALALYKGNRLAHQPPDTPGTHAARPVR